MLEWLKGKELPVMGDYEASYACGYNDALKDFAEHIAGGRWEDIPPKGRFGTTKYRCAKCGCESYVKTKYCSSCGSVMF